MDWKDTVIMPGQTQRKRKELFPHGHKDCFECERFVREAQAKITEDMLKDQWKQEGVREVVKWINVNYILAFLPPWKCQKWQAKLKQWGI